MQRKLNDEFIKEYSEEFSEKITSHFFEGQSKISGKEILNVTPSRQANLFVLKILFRKWQEEMKRLESPFFNYKNSEVRKAMVQFMNTLSQHIEVGPDHFRSMLEEAVADTLLIAADPGSYLSLEFEEMDVAVVNEKLTKPILKYIKLHKAAIQTFFEENNEAPLDDFVDEADTHFEDLDVDEVVGNELDLLSEIHPITMSDLFVSSDQSLDAADDEDEAALDFGDDLMEEEPEVEASAEPEDTEETQEEQGEEMPSEAFDPEENDMPDEVSSSEEQPEIDTYEEETFDEEAPEMETDDEEVDQEEADTPEEPEAGEEDEASLNERYASAENTINEAFGNDDSTLADQMEKKKVDSIMEAISVNHRYMFTKELFDGDREAFSAAIAKIEACESFDDAVELLVQRYAKDRGWDMNSEEVKELLKVVFRKFR